MSAVPSNQISRSTYRTSSQDGSSTLRNSTELLGRVLLVVLFFISGFGKITAYKMTAGYMMAVGVSAALLPLAIATELLGAVAILVGWKTRIVSVLLSGFTVLTGMLFHINFSDQTQLMMFLKNISIAGAFLLLAANGAGMYSVDARKAD